MSAQDPIAPNAFEVWGSGSDTTLVCTKCQGVVSEDWSVPSDLAMLLDDAAEHTQACDGTPTVPWTNPYQ